MLAQQATAEARERDGDATLVPGRDERLFPANQHTGRTLKAHCPQFHSDPAPRAWG
jgi:hypothetical protein